jgi:hypothetical protein
MASKLRMTTPNGIPIPEMPGVPIQKHEFNISKFNTTSRMQSCNPIVIDGAERVVRIGMPNRTNEEKEAIRACVFGRLPISTIDSIPGLPNGSYLYIVSDKGMFLNPVYSKLEVGSGHSILAHRVDADVVFCAGEIRISTKEDGKKQVEYNQMSGTYMMDRKADEKQSLDVMHVAFQEIAKRFGDVVDVVFRDGDDFLNIPLTKEELESLQSCGYEVDIFAKEDSKMCQSGNYLRNYLKDYKSHIAMLRQMIESGATEKSIVDKKTYIMAFSVGPLINLLTALKFISQDDSKRLIRKEDPEETMAELESLINLDETLSRFNSAKLKGGTRQRRRMRSHSKTVRRSYKRKTRKN